MRRGGGGERGRWSEKRVRRGGERQRGNEKKMEDKKIDSNDVIIFGVPGYH